MPEDLRHGISIVGEAPPEVHTSDSPAPPLVLVAFMEALTNYGPVR